MPNDIGLTRIVNLSQKLMLYVGATVMLTDDLNVSDRLINGSVATVKYIDMWPKPFCWTVFVEIDDPKAGNSLKDERLYGDLKECVTIPARAKRFPLKEREK